MVQDEEKELTTKARRHKEEKTKKVLWKSIFSHFFLFFLCAFVVNSSLFFNWANTFSFKTRRTHVRRS